ncbi:hypothetical protein [Streptomyces sp. NPDC002889]|uniref:hypothetical protein n=1 Tax=Streptomyces sp. NPDC002889 TaxID=3364669 RepID=UPI00369004C5
MGKKFFRAKVRDHRTGETSEATGTTDARNERDAKAEIQAEIRKLPGVQTVTDVDLY